MKGILFKPDMIKAITEGKKTQTRRLQGFQGINKEPDKWVFEPKYNWFRQYKDDGLSAITVVIKPCYQVGEVVYIKESWWCPEKGLPVAYKANLEPQQADKQRWKSPRFMPAWAARYHIQITGVKPQRLQEIAPLDAVREGCPKYHEYKNGKCVKTISPIDRYCILWDSINKEHQWSSNPWVWRYEFKRVEGIE